MTTRALDDTDLRAAMRTYLDVADELDATSAQGGTARVLLDLAEEKSIAAMNLGKRLEALGWRRPVPQRTTT